MIFSKKDNKKVFILGLNVLKVIAYKQYGNILVNTMCTLYF